MRLDIRAWSLATGLTMLVLYTLCALWVAISPMGFMETLGYLTHIDLTSLARPLSWGSFLSGLVAWTLVPALVAAGFAWGYNRLARMAGAPAVTMMPEAVRERVRR